MGAFIYWREYSNIYRKQALFSLFIGINNSNLNLFTADTNTIYYPLTMEITYYKWYRL